jgi:dienelactone hydrolase
MRRLAVTPFIAAVALATIAPATIALAGCDEDGASASGPASSGSSGTASTATTTSGAGGSSGGGGATAAPNRSDVALTTSDGLNLTGYLTAGGASPPGSPGVVLLHQYTQTDEQWGQLPEELAKRGYRTLAFNLRGHGDSDAYGGGALSGILTDPAGAPRDVDAAIAYLKGAGQADPARIAVVGTSIGANLAVASSIDAKAKTYVAFSARMPPTEALAGKAASGMASVFYLAGENDAGGQAADSQTMHDATADPRAIHIYPGSADHGIALLTGQADADDKLFDWLKAQL